MSKRCKQTLISNCLFYLLITQFTKSRLFVKYFTPTDQEGANEVILGEESGKPEFRVLNGEAITVL